MQRLQNTKCMNRADEETLVTPPEQFTDTNIDIQRFLDTSTHLEGSCEPMKLRREIIKSDNCLQSPDIPSVYSDIDSNLHETSVTASFSREEIKPYQLSMAKDNLVLESEDRSENIIAKLQLYFSKLNNSTILNTDNTQQRLLIEDVMDNRNERQEVHFCEESLTKKVQMLEEEERCIEKEFLEIDKEMEEMEERFNVKATDYEVKKLRLHGSEIEKIISLILSLTGRLGKILSDLDSVKWNGVEERVELEGKRDKLVGQLEEAKSIWHSMSKRTRVVVGYIEKYLSRMEGIRFRRRIHRRIRTMLEMKEIQEKIETGKKQIELNISEIVLL